ncbi:MAG: outer membrane lipoprotein carrier protein LolA [Spirochaetales bacterium]|jgi:outer membrane lipoprotein carrier protein|nr:outer membrane lipoprotein carrier protein LolA [Spirochaetales bacterium]
MRLVFVSLLIIMCPSISAQKDTEARIILDAFSEPALSAPAVSMKFKLTVEDKVEQATQESEGEVVIHDNMYKLELPDNIIWFDGNATWTLAPEVKEVTVTLPDPDDNTFLTSPSSLFDMYREGFKYRLTGESQEGYAIDLYPEDPSDTDFSIIKLVIDRQHRLVSAEYKRKDGINLFVEITEYSLDKEYAPDYFTFDPDANPGVDIIDMR